ncbi:carbohydrate ABC transporter substrate-binding protein [Acidaminobacter sp. JC074]|uniref:ABC transporter substrate-binding protein n=1 Tax=Acidaminobacter sp. JC074 TaxID=2530199 RepID=UPI001F0FE73D|nr:ABC transporter substrate-binding protein [Acidaminobacter sp. JC074]MCH4889068.1 carbohydrate ABC transporter substrate-binding protein [Acidaminobacter sp. JC074]
MKKFLSLLMIAALLMTSFVACSGGDSGSDEAQEVVIYQNKVEIHDQLSAFAALYTEETGVKVTIKTSGGDSPYAENLKAEFQSDRQPDIFVIEGMGGYNTWKEKLQPFGQEEWLDLTSLEFVVEDKVYGFPVAVEAWGMIYNVAMLEKAGIDPATLTSQEAYRAAFEKIDSMKDELGIDSVVAMAAGPDMRWVTGLHNFNGYLSAGLEYGDTSVLDKLNAGEADMARLTEYADWVELLFEYADKAVLLTGNYNDQLAQFGTEKAAFLHQGNWTDPSFAGMGISFDMKFAPHASVAGDHNAIFIGAPSYYVLNNESKNLDAAKAFINFIATSEAGHNYMVNEVNMVPAFTNVTLTPSAPLSANVSEWLGVENGAYTWLQNDMPDGFGMGTIAPIYESFAKGDIDKAEFIKQIQAKIEELK